jgi:single-strand DNA-binding protein
MNSITLSGRLTADPELVGGSERPICRMRIAVDNGRHRTTFIDVRTFDEEALICEEHLRMGRLVGVNGKLIYEEWRAPDGSQRSTYSVIGRVDFLDPPQRVVSSRVGPVDGQTQIEALATA